MGKWEKILLQFLDAIKLVRQEGEEIPEEVLLKIADTLRLLWDKVKEERKIGQAAALAPIAPEQIKPAMPSSNVEGFSYDPDSERLFVRFLGDYPNRNGPIYSYEGVPQNIFKLFQAGAIPARTNGKNKWGQWWTGKVPSIGASLYTLIKNQGYPYQRVS